MRFSSIVALVVVTASFALGGCAADAEPATGSGNDNVTLEGTADNDGRANDVRTIAKLSDQVPNHALDDGSHVRIVDTHAGNGVNPFIAPPVLSHGGSRTPGHYLSPEQMEAVVDAHTSGDPKP